MCAASAVSWLSTPALSARSHEDKEFAGWRGPVLRAVSKCQQHTTSKRRTDHMNIQQNNTSTRRRGIVRSAFAAGAAVAAFVAMGSATSANASYPVEESAPHPVTATFGTVTSPCHIQPTWNRINHDVGETPRCTHTYGAVSGFAIDASGPRNGTGPAVRHSVDNISGYEAQFPAGNVTPDAGTSSRAAWAACFYNAKSFHAWEKVQVGMPRCDIQGSQADSFSFKATAFDVSSVANLPCYMVPAELEGFTGEGGRGCRTPV